MSDHFSSEYCSLFEERKSKEKKKMVKMVFGCFLINTNAIWSYIGISSEAEKWIDVICADDGLCREFYSFLLLFTT